MNKIKKLMSIFLLMALMLSVVGEIAPMPDAKAAAPKWMLYSKFACYDARADSYAECANETLYSGEPTTLYVKRTAGPRIPKGTYLAIFKIADYNSLIEEGLPIVQNTNYAKYRGARSAKSSNTRWWYFKNGFSAGTYKVCIILPFYDENSRSKMYTYKTWTMKVYNYG